MPKNQHHIIGFSDVIVFSPIVRPGDYLMRHETWPNG